MVNELVENNIETNNNLDGENTYSGKVIQVVTFLLDDIEYSIDILKIHGINRISEITRLPNTPSFIKGVINLRGDVIPVVDARIKFGYQEAEITDLTRIIIIEDRDKQVGLLVDQVYQVLRIPEDCIDKPTDLIDGISEEFIRGVGRLKDRLVIVLNLDNVIEE